LTLDLPLGAKCLIPDPPGVTKAFINRQSSTAFASDPSLCSILRLTKTARNLWDIGANIGLYSLIAKASNPSLEVVSVEASTSAYAELCRNWSLKPDKWICIHAAIGAHEGKALLTRGLCGLNHVTDPEEPKSLYEIRPSTTLDRLAALLEVDHIDVLKIDVEGMELAVLKGATGLLRERRIGCLVTEADGHETRYGFSTSDVCLFLESLGYQIDREMSQQERAGGNCLVFRNPANIPDGVKADHENSLSQHY
jgi:FkbM family methyltransferase